MDKRSFIHPALAHERLVLLILHTHTDFRCTPRLYRILIHKFRVKKKKKKRRRSSRRRSRRRREREREQERERERKRFFNVQSTMMVMSGWREKGKGGIWPLFWRPWPPHRWRWTCAEWACRWPPGPEPGAVGTNQLHCQPVSTCSASPFIQTSNTIIYLFL